MTAENLSLRDLIVSAYGVRDYQVEGPEWLGSTRFDVQAKFPEALPKPTFVYALTIGKSGIRFSEAPPDGPQHSSSHNTHYSGKCVTMDGFAEFLSRRTDLPTLDMTGLKGCYDVTVDWVGERAASPTSLRRDRVCGTRWRISLGCGWRCERRRSSS